MSNSVPFPPKSEVRSPSMEVDKGRGVRGAANCRVGTASSVPGGEGREADRTRRRPNGRKKRMGKMTREDQAESGRHRSGRRGCASTVTPEADRQRRQVGSREGRTRAGSVRQHDVTRKGKSGIQGPQTATAVTGVEGNGVQTDDKINERMESRESVGGGSL